LSTVWLGFGASFLAGAMTAVGALPVLFGTTVSRRLNDLLLSFAAGVMLAASFFSLLVPGLAAGAQIYGGKLVPASIAVVGIVLGVALVAVLNTGVPHQHFVQGRQGPLTDNIARIWLFVLAITIHNLPEGLAVGVGFGGGDIGSGTTLAIGIGLQNAPEGLAVAVALSSIGYSKHFAFLVASLTGAVEPVAGFIGASAVSSSQLVLPWAMTFAAGAMLYVISHEIIPETHRNGYQNEATFGLTIGFVIMLFLDVVFS
jgi:zinc transporter, ZIP family